MTKWQKIGIRVGILILILIGVAIYRFGSLGATWDAVWKTFVSSK